MRSPRASAWSTVFAACGWIAWASPVLAAPQLAVRRVDDTMRPLGAVVIGATAYVVARTSATASTNAIYATDGTANGTTKVVESEDPIVGIGAAGSSLLARTSTGLSVLQSATLSSLATLEDAGPPCFLSFGGRALFHAGGGLWISDGTAAGTRRLQDAPPCTGGATGIAFGGKAVLPIAGPSGLVLWGTNAAGDDVEALQTLGTAPGTSTTKLVTFNGVAYFLVSTPGAATFAFWRTDGTPAGTMKVADLAHGNLNQPRSLGVGHDGLYLRVHTALDGTELWKSDGSAASTKPFMTFASGPTSSQPTLGLGSRSIAAASSSTFFLVVADSTSAPELWRTDGKTAGTVKQTTPAVAPPGASVSHSLVEHAGLVLATFATTGARPRALWAYDATGGAPVQGSDGYEQPLVSLGSTLLVARDGLAAIDAPVPEDPRPPPADVPDGGASAPPVTGGPPGAGEQGAGSRDDASTAASAAPDGCACRLAGRSSDESTVGGMVAALSVAAAFLRRRRR